jgi:hypothetical protein
MMRQRRLSGNMNFDIYFYSSSSFLFGDGVWDTGGEVPLVTNQGDFYFHLLS